MKSQALSGLAALAHEGRLDLFRLLVQSGPDGIAAGQLADQAGVNFTTASAQLSVLAAAQLVAGERQGRSVVYRANYEAITQLIAFLMKDCCQGHSDVMSRVAELATDSCCEPHSTKRANPLERRASFQSNSGDQK